MNIVNDNDDGAAKRKEEQDACSSFLLWYTNQNTSKVSKSLFALTVHRDDGNRNNPPRDTDVVGAIYQVRTTTIQILYH